MKLGQNVCLNEISYKFENGSCRVKYQVSRSNLREKFVYAIEATFSAQYF